VRGRVLAVAVFAFDPAGGQIKHIWAVRDPGTSGGTRQLHLISAESRPDGSTFIRYAVP
jgi:hypothetical protein